MFKMNLRRLMHDRQSTILNLVGLSTGLACALLIWLWVHDELQTDRFHANGDRIYQVMVTQQQGDLKNTNSGTSGGLGQELTRTIPGVEQSVTMAPQIWFEPFSLSVGNNTLSATGNFVSKNFFSVFSFDLLEGNKNTVLTDKHSVVISKSLALRLFHTTENVVGKTLTWKLFDFTHPAIITGVYNDMPANSTIRMDFVLNFGAWVDQIPVSGELGNGTGPFETYVLLKQGADVQAAMGKWPFKIELSLRKFTDRYLQEGGKMAYVRMFSLIAIFILIIACINFMNLSTANAAGRMKEVGIRKAIGASRVRLIRQFLGESLLLSCMALLLALGIVLLLMPAFNAITGKQLSLKLDYVVVAIPLITGLLAGSYPAFYLTGFHPVVTLKGKFLQTSGNAWARKGLVIFQFVISVVFIIAVLVIYQQIKFIQQKSLGFNRENVIYFQADGPAMERKDAMIAGIKQIPGVVNASSMMRNIIMPAGIPESHIEWDGKNKDQQIRFTQMLVNYDLPETLGMTLLKGRSFSRDFSTDKQGVVLNETAVKAMELKDPIGKTIYTENVPVQIIGVVKDFHFNSLHDAIQPYIFRLWPEYAIITMVRVHDVQTIDRIAAYYKQFNPGYTFNYKFLDDAVQAQYKSEQVIGSLSRYFAGLAILISCLGLFGLVAFTAEKRKKEISIRKILGASVKQLALLLSGDFLQLVMIAIVIAFPLAAWMMEKWLQGFAYRIYLQPGMFVLAAVATLLITVCTVSFQSLKAAFSNPVKALSAE
ncbi:ABC transporter permease [Chitinophaga sp. LS1]|uniref:ABC transporter permease n=1 Tax=Chitinophaga sp. LS1 TaxID=3051176 RepID=UPI002AABBDAF|nr:ABC transporter permease [Chitinophaga sp. LS1]WPV64142.1 ABC transporter permease [Chitinophaga sp. LS1]